METCFNILLLIVLCNLNSLGQENNVITNHPQKFISKFEIFAGPSIVGAHDNSDYSVYGTIKIGVQTGIGFSHFISKQVDLSLNLYFERKGFSQEAEAFYPPDIYNVPPTANLPPISTQITSNLNNDYVSVSLSPRFFIDKEKKCYIEAGIYGSHLVKSQITVSESQNGELKRKTILNQGETYKSYDWGLSFSLGYAFRVSKKITLGPKLLWNYGMMNIVELQPGLSPMKNNSFVLLINASFKKFQ